MPDFPISPTNPWLAPLAGFSDLPFRLVCRKYGCNVAVTEMVSAKGLFYNFEHTKEYLATTKEDSPLIVQIFGNEPQIIAQALSRLKDMGYKYFDLNAGCPVKKVTKTGAGAGLLKDISTLTAILEVMAKVAGEENIGVKIRLGWNKDDPVYLKIARVAEELGLGWITLHPRYAKEGFSGKARWECIKELKEYTKVPVIASGDLFTAIDGVNCINYTKADSLMFARGALKNPLIFREYKKLLKYGLERNIYSDLKKEKIIMIKLHIFLIKKYAKDKNPILRLRTIMSRYLRGYNRSKSLRELAVRVSSWEDVDYVIKLLEEEQV